MCSPMPDVPDEVWAEVDADMNATQENAGAGCPCGDPAVDLWICFDKECECPCHTVNDETWDGEAWT